MQVFCNMSVAIKLQSAGYYEPQTWSLVFCLSDSISVRMWSIFSATSSASAALKHIGGLNLMTFSSGPSVLTTILSSFILVKNRRTSVTGAETRARARFGVRLHACGRWKLLENGQASDSKIGPWGAVMLYSLSSPQGSLSAAEIPLVRSPRS